ncbi:MAG: YraN family protein [Acidobacteriia bacterium]|nr:YraN family protein [Terriglobia bacterium]
MSLIARIMYRALVWKERQRALRENGVAGEGFSKAQHLATGQRGETLAYWYLRRAGYTIVARNRPARSGKGEVDMVAWDGPVLAFVEVKTRTSEEGGRPEEAVSRAKQQRITKVAREYLRRLRRRPVNYRFDIVSVSWHPKAGCQVRLIKDAFKA